MSQQVFLILGLGYKSATELFVKEYYPQAKILECGYESEAQQKQNIDADAVIFSSSNETRDIAAAVGSSEVVGILNRRDLYEFLHAKLCDLYSVAGPSEHALSQLSDKSQLHQLMRELKLHLFRPQTIITTLDKLESLTPTLQFPLVIKAFAGAHSRGVYKIENRDDLQQATVLLEQHFEQEKIIQNFDKENKTILIESFVVGKQVAPVCYVDSRGKLEILSLVRCLSAQELGINSMQLIYRSTPSNFSEEITLKMHYVLQKLIATSGLKSTFLHPEFIVHKQKLFLIEINTRLGGYREQLYLDAFGIDLNKYLVALALDKEVRHSYERSESAAVCEIWSEESGVLKQLTVPKSKHITKCTLKMSVGDAYTAPPHGNTSLGIIYCRTPSNALKEIKSIRNRVKIAFE